MGKGICTPLSFLLAVFTGALYLGGAAAYDTSYDKPFLYACPTGQMMDSLSSVHNNFREDRKWDFSCRAAPLRANPTNCYWTGYVNGWDKPISFQCPSNYLVAGIQSYHNNFREDRRYKFKCCTDYRYETSSCYLTSYRNGYDGTLNYKVPPGTVLTGVHSEHSNLREDRRFKFQICLYGRR